MALLAGVNNVEKKRYKNASEMLIAKGLAVQWRGRREDWRGVAQSDPQQGDISDGVPSIIFHHMKRGNDINTRDITLAVSAGIIGAVITLLADHSLVSTQANAAILMLPNAANPTVVEQISVLDDHLWGFHVDGDRIRTCTSSTNSRTLTAPRCSDWTG